MKRDGTGKANGTAPAETDTFELINVIRGLPRVRPRRAARARVMLYSRFPTLGLRLENRREATRINRGITGGQRARAHLPAATLGRLVAAAAMVLVMAFGAFGALSIAAGDSRPGDALYSVKRLKEDVELAFTWKKSSRMEKSLALARTRLSELSYLLENDRLTEDSVRSVVSDYGERTRAVEQMLRADGALENAGAAALELNSLRARERGLEKRLAAASPHLSLSPAGGAAITVKDTGNGRSPGRAGVTGRADEAGGFSFQFDNPSPDSRAGLEVHVESDGRSQVLPLYPRPARAEGEARCSVSPAPGSLLVGRPVVLTAAFTAGDGSALDGRRVTLRDSSGTASIDGSFGDREFVTDGWGRCSFTLVKESLGGVTRVTARLFDGGWRDLGEVLVTGGLRLPPGPDTRPVRSTAAGPPEGPQDIELENGLMRLGCAAGAQDQIVGAMTCLSNSATAGPLSDPAASGATAVPGTRRSGPHLVSSDTSSASYRVSFEIPADRGVLEKVYTVTLDAGSPYAVVTCSATARGPVGEAPLELGALTKPATRPVEAGGTAYALGEGTTVAAFELSSPFATFESAGGHVVYACPSDSAGRPSAWVLEQGRLIPRLGTGAGSQVAMMLSVTDGQGARLVQDRALGGLFRQEPADGTSDWSSSGFLVVAEPPSDRLERGVQRVTVSVYKRYRSRLADLD